MAKLIPLCRVHSTRKSRVVRWERRYFNGKPTWKRTICYECHTCAREMSTFGMAQNLGRNKK